MQLRELHNILQALVGERVHTKTIAGNSISIWFSVEPKSTRARRIWIDPPWRIETHDGIESTSLGFPYEKEEEESDSEYRARFEKACAASDCLKDKTLTAISVDPLTSDLTITLNDGRKLRAFAIDPDGENWHFTDHGEQKRYGVMLNGVAIERANA
jgi:hypothetical protein